MSQKEVTMAMTVKRPDTIHPTSCAAMVPHRQHTISPRGRVEKHVGGRQTDSPHHIPHTLEYDLAVLEK